MISGIHGDYFVISCNLVLLSFNDNPIPYIMSRKHSVDIDTWDDLDEAERIMKIKTL